MPAEDFSRRSTRKSEGYVSDVHPDAGAAQHLVAESKRRKSIGTKEIEAVVAKIARIPPKNVSKDDAEVLKDLEKSLKRVVFGQDTAIEALSSAIKLARAGLREPEKPIGNYPDLEWMTTPSWILEWAPMIIGSTLPSASTSSARMTA